MSDLPRNRAGFCTACYEPLFDVDEVWTEETAGRGSPLVGEPRRYGEVYDNAFRVGVLFTDGTTTMWTVCEECVDSVNENLPRIWAGVIRAFAFDWKAKPWMFGQALSEEQLKFQADDICRVASLAPLGVLYSERWTDMIARENG